MYEVSCPSCRAVVSTPFVRIGAVVTCASCKHRYLVDASHIRRVPTPRQPGTGGTAAAAEETFDFTIGELHDLTQIMQREAERERNKQFHDYDTLAPSSEDNPRPSVALADPNLALAGLGHKNEPPAPSTSPASVPPTAPTRSDEIQAQSRQKARRGGLLMISGVALALAIVGVAIWSVDWNRLGVIAPVQVEPPADPQPVYTGPMFQGLPLVESRMLNHRPWELTNQPYESAPAQDPDVYVTDDDLLPAGAGVIAYVGRVVCDRPGVVLAGELSVSLVTPQGIERARTTIPIALVSQSHPLPIQVPIPANLDPTTLHPAWSIRIGQSVEMERPIQEVVIDVESSGADTMAKVTLSNDTGEPTENIVLLITAWDEDGRPLRRWTTHWSLMLKPGDNVAFFTRTPVVPSWRIDHWSVRAVAQ